MAHWLAATPRAHGPSPSSLCRAEAKQLALQRHAAACPLTIPSGQQATATMGAQGLSESDDDWQNRLTFAIGAH